MSRSELARRWRDGAIPSVTQRPRWLEEARAHLRKHYPHDGVAESLLYVLHGAGFGVCDVPDEGGAE